MVLFEGLTSSGKAKVVNVDDDGNLVLLGSSSSGVQAISASSLPLPIGAATDVTLQQVRDAIKAQIDISSTIWTDNSGVFYVRHDSINEGTGAITVTFTDPSGNPATPGAGLRPLATTNKETITDFYDVLTSGTGYSVGDLLARVGILDVNSSTPSVTAIWLNLSLGTILGSAPISANIERANNYISATQAGTWNVTANLDATDSGYLSSLSTAIGNFNTNFGTSVATAATSDTGTANFISLFKRALQGITTLISGFMPPGTLTNYLGTSSGANLKSSGGTIYAIICSNDNAAVRYFQIFDEPRNPTLNDLPLIAFPVYSSDGLLIIGQDILGGAGIPLSSGVSWGFSSTRLTYTAATATDCIASVRWQ